MEKFKFDVVAQTLTITAKFAEAMNNPEGEEYKLVQKFRADFPALVIMRKTHKSATHYTTKSGEKLDRKSTRLNSSHVLESRMPSSA